MSQPCFTPITFKSLKLKKLQYHPANWLIAIGAVIGSWFLFPEGGFDWRNDIGPGARHWWPAPWEEGLIMAPWGALLLSPLGNLPTLYAIHPALIESWILE